MLLFCAKTIVKESCKFEVARLKKKKKKNGRRRRRRRRRRRGRRKKNILAIW